MANFPPRIGPAETSGMPPSSTGEAASYYPSEDMQMPEQAAGDSVHLSEGAPQSSTSYGYGAMGQYPGSENQSVLAGVDSAYYGHDLGYGDYGSYPGNHMVQAGEGPSQPHTTQATQRPTKDDFLDFALRGKNRTKTGKQLYTEFVAQYPEELHPRYRTVTSWITENNNEEHTRALNIPNYQERHIGSEKGKIRKGDMTRHRAEKRERNLQGLPQAAVEKGPPGPTPRYYPPAPDASSANQAGQFSPPRR